METIRIKKSIRTWTWFFMVTLALSGITASPVEWELEMFEPIVPYLPNIGQQWFFTVKQAIKGISLEYGFAMYAFDWLAFAHIIIAIFMYGLIIDPVRNQWLIKAAIIACLLVFPLAFLMGSYRGIPIWWQLIDCSFGAIGLIPLLVVQKKIKKLESLMADNLEQPGY